ncbi:MAG: hypothetical protein A3F82_05670 [Deltaproteobacteria bacterium RIFCSPLOWO2_12_FULL_44_12]|nr:MAG: hypothetical protein A2712_01635 [Deltaproteobacteria bacterium RIFCSPHIGHO2_01_FULL_43_49]OGQ15168.1 MAG: hypothetical protein A3D22_03840 [Deltaproteobacteria bacterium RIFCSPHIGHO2_02_FULL_44_53]OGQ27211.1 MAG: hypothetical protein A3D98_02230 [Deltaproteobacteria bacterium RIFCSPHIGHO2_12_FULL_44_21]OGQ31685.1 MAG: hypothetical protein A2979_05000 [Deltaproteobacteria bacterium RIFCSPLOWO2_01_FULL_45_74]OGQ42885.1 MAG: hypothetical protein A3I70_07305 [Deltaproteobacteria bacterium 
MKSEYRGLLAVVLSVGVLAVWYTFIAPPPKPSPVSQPLDQKTTQQETVLAKNEPKPEVLFPSNISTPSVVERKGGQEVVLENELVTVVLDTMGGIVKNWELKKYLRNGGEAKPVTLADPDSAILELGLRGDDLKVPFPIPFQATKNNKTFVDLRWNSKELVISKRLRLDPNSYRIFMEVEVENKGKNTIAFTPTMDWSKTSSEESPQRGVLFFKTPPDKWHPIYFKDGSLEILQSDNLSEQTLSGKTNWVGFESRYFLGGIVPTGKEASSLEIKGSLARLVLSQAQVLPGERWIQKFDLYGGPKELERLKVIGSNLDRAIGYGWTTWVAVPILYLLQLFYKVVHNYGLAIIILTVLIKLLLNPINKKSLQSMKGMQALQPRLKEIREKYGKDKERMNTETMQLFKAHKINPMGGCLPMLLQIPIYIALYNVLWNSVELYHAPFFWFYKDLSAPDPYLITPILLGITMFIQTKMTPSASADPAQQKIMMIMPIMFSGFMIFLPMGLVVYILVNTGMTILQQWMYKNDIRFRDLLRGRLPARNNA